MVAIGVRVPQEDVDFISRLKIAGATTPSDKVRAIISEARHNREIPNDYDYCFDLIKNLLSSFSLQTRQLEKEKHLHSALIARLLEWLPEIMAFIMSSDQQINENNEPTYIDIEADIVDRTLRLMESIMQLSVTKSNPCYDNKVITNRIETVLNLAKVIEQSHNQK